MTTTAGDGTTGPRARREPLTFQEYLTLERYGDVRHEYVGGQVFATTGGSRRHGQLTLLLGMAFANGFTPHASRVSRLHA